MRTCDNQEMETQTDGSRMSTGPVCGHQASRHYDVRKLGNARLVVVSRCVVHDLDVYWKAHAVSEAEAEVLDVTAS